MPKVTEVHMEARRRQVLDAAISCFSRNGFHKTTMQDISQEAKLSPGAIYRYFSSKEDIIEAGCRERQEARTFDFKLVQQNGDTLEALNELVGLYVRRCGRLSNQSGLRLRVQLWGEALRNRRIRKILRDNRDDILELSEHIIQRAQEHGDINPDLDATAVARWLLANIDGIILQKTIYRDVDIKKYFDVVQALYSGNFWRKKNEGTRSAP